MLRNSLSFLCLFFFISCTTQSIVITPDYKDKTFSDLYLYVVLTDQPVIENGDDVYDDLGHGNPDEVYMSFFIHNFPKKVKYATTFKNVYLDKTCNIQLEERRESLNDHERITIKFPAPNQFITVSDTLIDFTLLIQELKIHRKAAESGIWTGGPTPTGGSSPKLVHSGKFTIWDNSAGQLVSYGKFESEESFLFAMGQGTWESGVARLAKDIFYGSPFASPRIKSRYPR
ncbi:MAG: hypothetical protein JXR46_01195 [Calditrichaceae bacterium]|nr:hypothetical protein [Calditrichaceae bacterium]MBN2707632.1 hypothetical protein [Calditrichaceae bacterium]RQV93198.1 MAG: hypothetical protein EH224_12940 [Calditrichota bacterium]